MSGYAFSKAGDQYHLPLKFTLNNQIRCGWQNKETERLKPQLLKLYENLFKYGNSKILILIDCVLQNMNFLILHYLSDSPPTPSSWLATSPAPPPLHIVNAKRRSEASLQGDKNCCRASLGNKASTNTSINDFLPGKATAVSSTETVGIAMDSGSNYEIEGMCRNMLRNSEY